MKHLLSGDADAMRTSLCLLLLALAGCDLIPRDAAGALEEARGGELRVGVSPNPPWVITSDGRVAGLEPELIERWASEQDARVVWQHGSVDMLVEALHRREIDVLAAGLDASTPFKPRLALTQPYLETADRFGRSRRHVLAVTQGESALLFALDRYLAVQDEAALRTRLSQP